MRNPEMLPGAPAAPQPATTTPSSLVRQGNPVNSGGRQPRIQPTRPVAASKAAEYVDPYLFEMGYYASRAEYEELARTATPRIQLRADVENTPPKRRARRST